MTSNDLHTLFIKHDNQFKTLSKIALSGVITKILYPRHNGARIQHIKAELSKVLSSAVSQQDVEQALQTLINKKKVHHKSGKYFIKDDFRLKLKEEVEQNQKLLDKTIHKYFSKAETNIEIIKEWFSNTIVLFFERYSFDWFYQVTSKSKKKETNLTNINELITDSLSNNKKIVEADKDWLKRQLLNFIESEDADDNLLFWYYGISMFSARLITARNYADKITTDLFKDSKFILDTNILMILELEEHELAKSLAVLEKIFIQLNITPTYFHITRDEYLRAMEWRKSETIRVFENFDYSVLKSSDCPFIKTALRRGCIYKEDVERMFSDLMEIPTYFQNELPIHISDYQELNDEIEIGATNDNIKSSINEIYKRRTGRDKREKALDHDTGMVSGAFFLRKSENCWIISSDSILKRYAIEHCLRDDNEIAIGLDVILGVFAVNFGGTEREASDFAPLFKNLVKFSLMPERDTFELADLSFILNTNIKVNELSDEKVIEVAKEVKKMRIKGTDEEEIALFLRRYVEGHSGELTEEIEKSKAREFLALSQKENAEKERDAAFDSIRSTRRGELRDQYDKELRNNRRKLIMIPIIILLLLIIIFKNIYIENSFIQWFLGVVGEIALSLATILPLNKRFVKKHSEYVEGINQKVENEIREIKRQAKL